MKEAMFWHAEEWNVVRCALCMHRCRIIPGRRGRCGVRENRAGRLFSLVYGRPVAMAIDPVEKKPLYHFLPGSQAFSLGTRGCNFRCENCQNSDISQVSADDPIPQDPMVPAEQVVQEAAEFGCASIAYTYTEPTIFCEYVLDIARFAEQRNIRNILVTNGYTSPEALHEVGPHIDGVNVDLKFFREDLYAKVCGARLEPVLDAVRLFRQLGVWMEITTLVIPGYNDDRQQLSGIASFIAEIGRDVPWHITAFFPRYRLLDAPATPIGMLERAREIGQDAGLKYVYLGNVGGRSDTLCPGCGTVLIERNDMEVSANRIDGGKCPDCGEGIAGLWQ